MNFYFCFTAWRMALRK